MRHLTCAEILEQDLMARYAAGRLTDDEVEALESHYLTCPRCYNELRLAVAIRDAIPEVAAIATADPPVLEPVGGHREADGAIRQSGRARRRLSVGAVVALASAAVLTLMVLRPGGMPDAPASLHRDGAPASASVPVQRAPLGVVTTAAEFRWSPVTGADRYRVTLYDTQGTVLWQEETPEPRVTPPEALTLELRRAYLWDVAARVDWNRWVRSPMTQFELRSR